MSNFLGSHAINMDAKGRLAIPARVREELQEECGGRIVLTANADEERCLLLYPEPVFENFSWGSGLNSCGRIEHFYVTIFSRPLPA